MAPRTLPPLAALLTLLLPLAAHAADTPDQRDGEPQSTLVAPGEPSAHELWLTTGFLSRHTGRSTRYHYNDHNDGVGLEWHWAPGWQLNAGHYRNSVRRNSSYLQVAWMPWSAPCGDSVRVQAGASLGVVNGYPKVEHSRYFGTLVPALALEGKRLGANVVYIPSVGKKVDGAFALQLKLRID